MTWQIVYVSTSLGLNIESIAESILQSSRENNAALGVTGVLLSSDGAFFQVLEGPRDVVEALYNKIARDPRHIGITRIMSRDLPTPMFDGWAMGWGKIGQDHPIYNHLANVFENPDLATDAIVVATLRAYVDQREGDAAT